MHNTASSSQLPSSSSEIRYLIKLTRKSKSERLSKREDECGYVLMHDDVLMNCRQGVALKLKGAKRSKFSEKRAKEQHQGFQRGPPP